MIDQLQNILSRFVFKQLTEELIRQGHKLTGSLIDSFETRVEKTSNTITIEFLMLNYGLSLNDGIPPPFYKKSGGSRGGKSKHIQGLIRWAKLKFFADQRRATQIAFAIARKHKEKGYPLTGKIGFIDNVLKADSERIVQLIQDFFEETISLLIDEYLNTK